MSRFRASIGVQPRFTIALESAQAVSEAYRRLAESGRKLGVAELCEPQGGGASCSFLLRDPDRNWWEISSPH